MNEIKNNQYQTPIEIALGIDENGMTTAKKLYEFLEFNPTHYARWCRVNITENGFAEENVDFWAFALNGEWGGQSTTDYKLTAHFAKKLSMKGSGEKAEQAREYFTRIEEKAKEMVINSKQLSPQTNSYFGSKNHIIDRSKLSAQMQMVYAMADHQAELELETQRIAAEQKQLKETIESQGKTIQTVKDTFLKESKKDFRPWVNQCVASIAESPNYQFIGSREEKYQAVRKESYDRLNQKKPCRLKQRVESEKGRALTAGASAARVNTINKLTIIENDKALKPIYETVLKEMMIAYCVDTAGKTEDKKNKKLNRR